MPAAIATEDECDYQSDRRLRLVRNVRVVLVVGIAAFTAFGGLDVWMARPVLALMYAVRVCYIVAMSGLFATTWLAVTPRVADSLGLTCAITVGSGCIILTQIASGGRYHPYHEALLLTMFGMVAIVPWRAREAILSLGALQIIYNIVVLGFSTQHDFGALLTNNAVYLVAFTLGAFAAVISEDVMRRQFLSARELQRANVALRELEQTKSLFFANVSHELRTPLTLILAPIEAMLSDGTASDKNRNQLRLVQRGALRLLRLVDDILALTRLQSTRVRLRLSACDLALLLHELLKQVTPWAERKDLTLQSTGPADGLIAECDENEIERVILNVLGNAVKFTPPGGTIQVAIEDVGRCLLIAVRDTGAGIPTQHLESIFLQYFQVEHLGEKKRTGTGLGLAICKQVIDLHGGRIWAQSPETGGTIISIEVPKVWVSPAEGINQRDVDISRELKLGTAIEEWQEVVRRGEDYRSLPFLDASERRKVIRGERKAGVPIVLLVEDNEDIQQFVSGLFVDIYEVYCASDGAAGLRMAIEVRPDLILSDVMMPNMDGFEMVRQLRHHEATASIPVVMLTARGGDNDKVSAHELGIDAYLPKPFNPAELRAIVNRMLKRQQIEQGASASFANAQIQLLVAQLAHELMNPVNFIKGSAYLLHMQAKAAEGAGGGERGAADESYQGIVEGISRITDLMKDMRRRLEGAAEETEQAEVETIVARVERLVGHTKRFVKHVEGKRALRVQKGKIEQVLVNLVLNAQQAMGAEGLVRLQAWDNDKGGVCISVSDEGKGPPIANMDKLFEPYYTTKSDGTGLGLAISRQIAREHGGDLVACANADIGMTFTLHLPAGDAALRTGVP